MADMGDTVDMTKDALIGAEELPMDHDVQKTGGDEEVVDDADDATMEMEESHGAVSQFDDFFITAF